MSLFHYHLNSLTHNQYDDFTKSLMIAWSLKLTNRYKQSKIENEKYFRGKTQSAYSLGGNNKSVTDLIKAELTPL